MQNPTLNIKTTKNGNLKLTLNNAGRKYLKENDSHELGNSIFDLFERYSHNGSYTLFDAGMANPFVGLTDAPCITEYMDYTDAGEAVQNGELYYFNNYMVENFVETLKNKGVCIFSRAV